MHKLSFNALCLTFYISVAVSKPITSDDMPELYREGRYVRVLYCIDNLLTRFASTKFDSISLTLLYIYSVDLITMKRQPKFTRLSSCQTHSGMFVSEC